MCRKIAGNHRINAIGSWKHPLGQYMTKMPPKELLEQKLSLAIANARELLEQRKEE